MTDPRPFKKINDLTVNDRIIVRRNATTGAPEKATVTSEPREGSGLGVWSVGIRYDGPAGDESELFRTEESPVELDNELPVAKVHLPELPGLTAVGEIDFFDGPAEVDVTGVWRDNATGQLYYADDSAYDVPTHEDITFKDLVPCTADELEAYLNMRLNDAEWMNDREPISAEIATLMARVHTAPAAGRPVLGFVHPVANPVDQVREKLRADGVDPDRYRLTLTEDGVLVEHEELASINAAYFALAKSQTAKVAAPDHYMHQVPGLTALGEIDFTLDPHEVDMTGVWRDDATGQLYYADDAACCRDAFEEFTRDDLTACTSVEVVTHLTKRFGQSAIKENSPAWFSTAMEIAEMLGRIHQR